MAWTTKICTDDNQDSGGEVLCCNSHFGTAIVFMLRTNITPSVWLVHWLIRDSEKAKTIARHSVRVTSLHSVSVTSLHTLYQWRYYTVHQWRHYTHCISNVITVYQNVITQCISDVIASVWVTLLQCISDVLSHSVSVTSLYIVYQWPYYTMYRWCHNSVSVTLLVYP